MANERILIDNDSLIDMGNAIREKNGTATTYKPSEMPEAIRNLGAGNIVNGIIEQYKAKTGTISADTFVEFVGGGDMAPGVDTSINSSKNAGYLVSAVKIDSNRVFVAYAYNRVYGVVCTINGTTITPGTETSIMNTSIFSQVISTALIDTNKVFITYNGDGTNNYLYGIVCEISETTITKGTGTVLVSVSNSCGNSYVTQIDTNKVFIAHRGDSNYLAGIVCTINGTTITPGIDTTLSTQPTPYGNTETTSIDTNKAFVIHNNNYMRGYLHGLVCTISGTTITVGTDTAISDEEENTASYSSIVAMGTDKVFIAHSSSSESGHLNGIVCTVSGTTITKGTDTALTSASYSAYHASASLVDENKVIIVHCSDSTNLYFNFILCTISGTTITAGVDTPLIETRASYYNAFPVQMKTNNVFIAHCQDASNYYLNGIMLGTEDKIIPSSTKIEGITKTQCTSSTAGDVWILNINN